jgi:S-formylglutathione hydrolase FrmB
MSVTTNATIASFGGKLLKLSHAAATTKCEMKFNLYLPPQAQTQKVPVLIYLSGLTCTADNCSEKGFFQHGASKKGIAVLYPDTSPRTFPYLLWFNFLPLMSFINSINSITAIARPNIRISKFKIHIY